MSESRLTKAFDAMARRAAYRIVQKDLRERGYEMLSLCDKRGRIYAVDVSTADPERLCNAVDEHPWPPPG